MVDQRGQPTQGTMGGVRRHKNFVTTNEATLLARLRRSASLSQIVGKFKNFDQCNAAGSERTAGEVISDLSLSRGVYWYLRKCGREVICWTQLRSVGPWSNSTHSSQNFIFSLLDYSRRLGLSDRAEEATKTRTFQNERSL
jgi:hypothetical protein